MEIELKNVTKTYKSGKEFEITAISNADLKISQGDYLSICGISGSGKSTLLHLLGCLDIADNGSILFDGVDSKEMNTTQRAEIRSTKIGFVFQDYALIPYRTVMENLNVPLYFSNISKKEFRKEVEKVLSIVSMNDYINRKVSTLSGGQKQKVAIARALICNPEIILADEPTGALDSISKSEVIDVFDKIHKMNKTLIVVTHDNQLAQRADRKILIDEGHIHEKI